MAERGRIGRLFSALLWSALMIAASSIPSVPHRAAPLLHYDKILHAVEYGLFAWLWWGVLRDSKRPALRRRAWFWVAVVGLLWAAGDEMVQGTIGRSRDPFDFLADAIGIAAALWIRERRSRGRGG